MTALALALGAALLFAVGTVLQARAALAEPSTDAGLLLRLLRSPVWLAGIAADGVGFLLHAGALGSGRLAVVQPVLAMTLVFALPLSAALDGRRISRHELQAAVVVTAGLALFLLLADPRGGHADASAAAWTVVLVTAAGVAAATWLLARRAHDRTRALLLGSATGVLFGVSAALTKTVVEGLDAGIVHVVTDWHAWALIVVGYTSTLLAQASLQTQKLGPAVATQTTIDPITSLLIGMLAFGERVHDTPLGAAAALAGVALMVLGTAVLASRTEAPRERISSAIAQPA